MHNVTSPYTPEQRAYVGELFQLAGMAFQRSTCSLRLMNSLLLKPAAEYPMYFW